MIQGAVFLAGRVPALLAQASGLSLRASLEVGSSFGVKCHHLIYSNRQFLLLFDEVLTIQIHRHSFSTKIKQEPAWLLLIVASLCLFFGFYGNLFWLG